MSLVQLSKLSGVSQPHLSQLENGKSVPTIALLYRVADALGVGAQDLLPQRNDHGFVVTRAGEGALCPISDAVNSAKSRFLAGAPGRLLEGHHFSVAPGEHLGDWLVHDGEEFVFVVRGTLLIETDNGVKETLQAGDAAWYTSAVPHRWTAAGADCVEIVLVNGRRP